MLDKRSTLTYTKSATTLPRLSTKENTILGLLVARGEMYGLQLVADSEGRLARGTVYVTLNRMEEKGFVESRKTDPPEGLGGPRRRLYRATGLGEAVLRTYESFGRRSEVALA